MFAYIANQLSVNVSANNLSVTSSGAATTAVDCSAAEGPILVTVIVKAGGSNTMTIQPQHSLTTTDGDFTNVPAAALVDVSTGQASTFATVSTAASVQTLGLNRELMRKYVRVNLTGTTLTQVVTVVFSFLQKYTA